jgi:hypothetical protein
LNDDQKQSVGLDIRLDSIQAVRLASAILESDYVLHFSEANQAKLSFLRNFFSINYQIGFDNIPMLKNIVMNHRVPLCKIGNIERPLLYPHAFFNLCQSKWQPNRTNTYYFSGLLTKRRREIFRDWVFTHSSKPKASLFIDFLIIKLMNKLVLRNSNANKTGISRDYSILINDHKKFKIVLSTKGRRFPIKVWDDDYFNRMANSKFVLCPNGDFIWTYRFFEAIICGAIPIIENKADIYEGFKFYKMSDTIDKYIYDTDIVKYNFDLAQKKLTLPKDVLNREIELMLTNKTM